MFEDAELTGYERPDVELTPLVPFDDLDDLDRLADWLNAGMPQEVEHA